MSNDVKMPAPKELSAEQQFLMKEYESASRLTYHIDELLRAIKMYILYFLFIIVSVTTATGQEQQKAQDSLKHAFEEIFSKDSLKVDPNIGTLILKASIRKVESKEGFYGSLSWTDKGPLKDRQFIAQALSARKLLSQAYKVTDDRIVENVTFLDNKYSVEVTVPEGSEIKLIPLLKQLIQTGIGVAVRKEMQEREVGILLKDSKRPFVLKKSESSFSYKSYTTSGQLAQVEGNRLTLTILSQMLSDVLHQPIIDKTGITERFDFNLEWEKGNLNSLKTVLSKLGLKLMLEERPLEVLVIDPLKKNQVQY